jgi:hypothetical protein
MHNKNLFGNLMPYEITKIREKKNNEKRKQNMRNAENKIIQSLAFQKMVEEAKNLKKREANAAKLAKAVKNEFTALANRRAQLANMAKELNKFNNSGAIQNPYQNRFNANKLAEITKTLRGNAPFLSYGRRR